MIELVFFDAGDTLLRPHPSFQELFASACSRAGYEMTPDVVDEVRGVLAPHLVDIQEETGVENPSLSPEASRRFWTFLYRRFLSELEIEDEALVDDLFSVFSDSASYALFDDVIPVLGRLRDDGYRLGLISNFEGWLEEMLIELEVGGIFDPAVISGHEGVEKPDPGIYRIALERSGLAPDRVVHVGDSPVMDAEPASSLGMKVVLLDRSDRYPETPFPRIRSLEELPGLVTNL